MASSNLSSSYGAVPTLFLFLAICTVSLRTYVRRGVLQTFLVEDWLCIVTLTLFIAQTALLYRFDDLTGSPSSGYSYYETLINIVIADVIMYLCSSIALKVSLAFFFLRFLVERWHRVIVFAMLILFVVDSLSSIFLVLFWCGNPAMYAAKTLAGQCSGTSNALNAANILQGVLNALTDWAFATLPMVVVIKTTTLSLREKIIVSGIFAFAVAGSVAAILRAVYWPALTGGTMTGFRTGMTWCTIEIGSGLVASSAATLRTLLKNLRLVGGNSSNQASGQTSSGRICARCSKHTESSSASIPNPGPTPAYKEWWDAERITPEHEDGPGSSSHRPSCILPDLEE